MDNTIINDETKGMTFQNGLVTVLEKPMPTIQERLENYVQIIDGKTVKTPLKKSFFADKTLYEGLMTRAFNMADALATAAKNPADDTAMNAAAQSINTIAHYLNRSCGVRKVEFGKSDVNFIFRHCGGNVKFSADEKGKISAADKNKTTSALLSLIYMVYYFKLNRIKIPTVEVGNDYEKYIAAEAAKAAKAAANTATKSVK